VERNHWYTVTSQSLATYARVTGFDLAVYEAYSKSVKQEVRKRAIKHALWQIAHVCYEQGLDLYSTKDGVYVISLSNPLSIQYRNGRSQVIYIGIGNVMSRLKNHFEKSLFDFMQSLAGANFDFHFARPALKGPSKMYYKHVEYHMLEYFCEQYGGMDDRRRFPILNSNAGSNQDYRGGTDWWKKPLKASGKRPLWELKPTDFSDFAPLDSGE